MSEVMERLLAHWREHPTERPSLDSPTYLRLTRRITEAEYHVLLNERRQRMGLPPIERP